MRNLAYMYFLGNGVQKDDQQGLAWNRKAAEAGNITALNDMAYFYEHGINGAQKDHNQAEIWYRKAAEAGDAGAMNTLGEWYEAGHGVQKDYGQALSSDLLISRRY